MTLEDIEAASVSSLRGEKEFPISRSVSPSLLECLIRHEIYWPAFHFADFSALRWEGGVGVEHFHGIGMHLYVKKNRKGKVHTGTGMSEYDTL